jgi:branched-chain amino acid transport system ATP-binding protein
MLKVESVTKKFVGVTALSRVSIEIKEKGIFGLIGPNGSGKTTLLNVISGFLKPDEGRITYNGESLIGLRPHKIAQMGIGRTFQFPRVFPNLSVEENIAVANPLLDGIQEYKELLQIFDLITLKDQLASSLGYGQKKILELARIMAMNPSFLMLDEPLAGLDSKMIKKMLNWIKELNSSFNETILIVEHNLDQLFSIADYVFVLHGGKKVEEGTPELVRQSKIVHNVYFGGL